MKSLILAFALLSGTVGAYELDATEALLSTLPQGNYQGVTPAGKSCQVSVSDLSGKVLVIAKSEGLTRQSEVKTGALYRWNPGNRSYLASTIKRSEDVVTENILRTIAVDETRQYVVVSDLVMSGRNADETLVECIIQL